MGISQLIPLRHLLSAYHCLPLSHTENKKVMSEKYSFDQFQVGYALNPELNINRVLKEQVEINLEKSFSGATIMPVRKVLHKGNTCVLSLLMFNENINNMKFKVSNLIFYYIMDNLVCVDDLCCPETKIHVTSKGQ